MFNHFIKKALIGIGATSLVACVPSATETDPVNAHGAPGKAPTWAYSGKTGIGTSYEQYLDGRYTDQAATGPVSRLWFSVARGVLTETMVGLIHQAQLKDSQFVITGPGFTDIEAEDTISHISYLHTDAEGRPLSLAYRIVNEDIEGRYTIEKHLVTDPDRNTLLQRVLFTAREAGIQAHLVTNPHMANTGTGDKAWASGHIAYAQEAGHTLALVAPDKARASVGFVGTSDLITDLADGKQNWHYTSTGETTGNVSLTQSLTPRAGQTSQWILPMVLAQMPNRP